MRLGRSESEELNANGTLALALVFERAVRGRGGVSSVMVNTLRIAPFSTLYSRYVIALMTTLD